MGIGTESGLACRPGLGPGLIFPVAFFGTLGDDSSEKGMLLCLNGLKKGKQR